MYIFYTIITYIFLHYNYVYLLHYMLYSVY